MGLPAFAQVCGKNMLPVCCFSAVACRNVRCEILEYRLRLSHAFKQLLIASNFSAPRAVRMRRIRFIGENLGLQRHATHPPTPWYWQALTSAACLCCDIRFSRCDLRLQSPCRRTSANTPRRRHRAVFAYRVHVLLISARCGRDYALRGKPIFSPVTAYRLTELRLFCRPYLRVWQLQCRPWFNGLVFPGEITHYFGCPKGFRKNLGVLLEYDFYRTDILKLKI